MKLKNGPKWSKSQELGSINESLNIAMSQTLDSPKSVVVEGHGVFVRYGFLSRQMHDQLQASHKRQVPIESLSAICKRVACKGFFSKHLKISIANGLVLSNLEDIKEHFPITFYPDTGLIDFGARRKYALVHLQHLSGKWVDDEVSTRGLKGLIFQYQYHDFDIKHHFPLFELKLKGKSLKEGEMRITQEDFFLFDENKIETRLRFKC